MAAVYPFYGNFSGSAEKAGYGSGGAQSCSQKVEVVPEVKPWEKIKDPAMVMDQCEAAVAKLVSIVAPGWKIGDISCTQGSAATSFKRDFGRISWMRQAVSNPKLKLGGKIFQTTATQ